MHKHIIFILGISLSFCFNTISFADDRIKLSLEEAILLAIGSNPNVEARELSHVTAKFNTFVQEWQFYPHYNVSGDITLAGSGRTNDVYYPGSSKYNFSPSVSLLTPIGTKFTLASTNTKNNSQDNDHYNPGLSLQVIQPLVRGFGRPIVESALCNARDSELISRLNVQGVLRTTITDIINSYLDVISAERALQINEQALKRALDSVTQTKLYIKAGRKAGNELVTVQANVASSQARLEDDKNTLSQARYALLAAIGLDPNTNIELIAPDPADIINKYKLPSLDVAKEMVLKNDVAYQTEIITLNGATKRALLNAIDNTRPDVRLTANVGTGSGVGGGFNAGVNSLYNGANRSSSVALAFEIPIDNQIEKQQVLNARIALKEAQLALKQSRWSKETGAINGWKRVGSAELSMKYALDAEKLQAKTYQVSYQKYLHGLIDSLELQSAQVQLIEAQQTSLRAKITYIKSLVSLDLLTGNTLRTWNIKVRF